MVECKNIEISIKVSTGGKTTDVLYSVVDDVMTVHSFSARFIADNYKLLAKAIDSVEEIALDSMYKGINMELQVEPEDKEIAAKILMARGYFIPDVDSYVIEVDVDNLGKSYVMGFKDSRASIDPTRRMKKTTALVGDVSEIEGQIVDALSYSLVSDHNPKKAGISILSTEKEETLVAEYIMVDDENIRELVPYLQVLIPGIVATGKYQKFQVMASSFILANIFKKMFEGIEIREKIVLGSYKVF